MEGEAQRYHTNTQFKGASSVSADGGLVVKFSTSDEDFKTLCPDACPEEFKIEKICRCSKDGCKSVVIGQEGGLNHKNIPALAGKVFAEAQRAKATSIQVVLLESVTEETAARVAHCINIANYRYDVKKEADRKPELSNVTLVHAQAEAWVAGEIFRYQFQVSIAKNLSRDLCNKRANVATTDFFVAKAKSIQKEFGDKVKVTVLQGEKELVANRLNLIYAVGKGSSTAPALISLAYNGNPDSEEYHAIVGKGIVYDQGGVNCKTALLDWMWIDKGGACSCLAAFHGVASLGLKVNLVCTVAVAENIVSGSAYRTSDIITSHKGLTVEVLNTDAEGRLVLVDAMSWTQENHKVNTLIDVATLTGAIIISLGENVFGVFSNKDDLAKELVEAGKEFDEVSWHMPICDTIAESMKSKVADLKNISGAQWGGSIQGASFLRYFVNEGVNFAHLDIAGTVKVDAPKGMFNVGATGSATGTLVHWIKNHSA